MSAYVSLRQHTSAYVSIRQHTSEFVSIPALPPAITATAATAAAASGCFCVCCCIRQHTSAYVGIRQHTSAGRLWLFLCLLLPWSFEVRSRLRSLCQHTSAYVSIRQHPSVSVSIRQHTSASVSIRSREYIVNLEAPRSSSGVSMCTFVLAKQAFLYLLTGVAPPRA
jgi:hypothetical protein